MATPVYPDSLREAEEELIRVRRGAKPGARIGKTTGLACSGGGIRSATFCLGFAQALARAKRLAKFDYLSTVSGGGYFGAFLGRMFARDGATAASIQDTLADTTSRPLRHLRANGRYLAPRGAGDLLLAFGVLVRNGITLHLLLWAFALMAFLLLNAIGLTAAAAAGAAEPEGAAAFLAARHGASIWWSAWWIFPACAAVAAVIPAGWAYWLALGRWSKEVVGFAIAGGVVLALLMPPGTPLQVAGIAFAVLAAAAAFFWRRAVAGAPDEKEVRNALSKTFTRWLVVALAGLAFVVVDSLGRTLYVAAWDGDGWWKTLLGWVAAGYALLGPLGRQLPVLFGGKGGRPGLPASVLSLAAGVALASVVLLGANTLAHGLTWAFERPVSAPPVRTAAAEAVVLDDGDASGDTVALRLTQGPRPRAPFLAPDGDHAALAWPPFVVLLVLCLFLRNRWHLLNNTSHHALYSARLIRAYLGASNPARTSEDRSVTRVVEGDDAAPDAYWSAAAYERGAPLHLINTTLNETFSAKWRIQNQDRKGEILAAGPCALSVGRTHHRVRPWSVAPAVEPESGWRMFAPAPEPADALTVGQWVGVSGAAFSTGLGSRTTLGLSLLTGLANVRLGVWWDAGVRRPENRPGLLRRLFPLQTHLFSELVCRFPGPLWNRWYLSDGGHYENMGVYELLRRRVDRIVLLDAEADPDYRFEGLANLVRKARIDFQTEIAFDRKELRRLRRLTRGAPSAARTAEGVITYPDGKTAELLYVKPALLGNEPADVAHYHATHADFPQQTTADQFFDEAQWESYRKLGELTGTELDERIARLLQTRPARKKKG